MRVRVKVWFEHRGEQVFGSGKATILRAVEEAGSLNAAATQLGMSYRHVWTTIHAAEERLGKPLLDRQRGGTKGGGATLTRYARKLIKQFDALENDVRDYTEQRAGSALSTRKGRKTQR